MDLGFTGEQVHGFFVLNHPAGGFELGVNLGAGFCFEFVGGWGHWASLFYCSVTKDLAQQVKRPYDHFLRTLSTGNLLNFKRIFRFLNAI